MENNKETKEIIGSTNSNIEKVDSIVTTMERVKGFIDKHGIKGTFTTLMVLLITVFVGYVAFNPAAVIEKYQEVVAEQHNTAVKARLSADPKIRTYLMEMKLELGANRVYVLETHNGGANLTNLPFLYVDLTYAEPKNNIAWLEKEYNNLRLSRHPWAAYVYNHGSWFGPVEDIEKEDPELYHRLENEEVAYMGMMMMYGNDSMPSGTLGIVYTEEDEIPNEMTVTRTMQKYATIISGLLSTKK